MTSPVRAKFQLAGILMVLLLVPVLAHAQTNCSTGAGGFVPLACTSDSSKLGQLYSSTDFSSYINGLFTFGISLGAILAVLRLAYAGYLYMGSAEMWSNKTKAKSVIGDVVLGLLILLGIWLILDEINPDILQMKALQNIKPVPKSSLVLPIVENT